MHFFSHAKKKVGGTTLIWHNHDIGFCKTMVFFAFLVLWCTRSGDHLYEDLAKLVII
jgi:hypothetical protein